MGGVSRGQLPGKGEDVLSLSSGLFWCLIWGNIHVDRCWWDDREEGSEKEVRTLGVEVHRQRGVEVSGWNTEGHDGNGDGGASCLGDRVGDGAKWWKVGTVCGEDDVVRRVEGDLVATIRGSVVGLCRVDGEHVGGHLRREIVDHDGELLRESWRLWEWSWLDTPEDLVHSGQHIRGLQEAEKVVNLLGSESGETLLDILDGSLTKFWVDGGEGVAANFLVVGAGKMPRELNGGLFHDWPSCCLGILHLDILDRDREGFEAETKGLGGR